MEGIMSDKKSAILRAAKVLLRIMLQKNFYAEERQTSAEPFGDHWYSKRFEIYCISGIFQYGYQCYRISRVLCGAQTQNDLYDRLKNQIEIALLYHGEEPEEAAAHADRTACGFFEQLPEIQRLLLTDVQAGFDGDPAAKSKEEIIFSYPGLFAIYVYRLAHVLYKEEIPFIPRVMSEYAHGRTGIDINPGATSESISLSIMVLVWL